MDEYLEDIMGNINHEVQPVIGWLRLAIHDGKTLTPAQMQSAVEKLYRAIGEANKLSEY